jgi:hypothetical protein
MQCVPDFKQHPFAILLPLMIPEPEFFNAGSRKNVLALLVVPLSFRQTMPKAVEFDGQFCAGTIN